MASSSLSAARTAVAGRARYSDRPNGGRVAGEHAVGPPRQRIGRQVGQLDDLSTVGAQRRRQLVVLSLCSAERRRSVKQQRSGVRRRHCR
jgi:hypothetical protein